MLIDREINLRDLANEALMKCPESASVLATEGFVDFIQLYFQEIQRYSDLFAISDTHSEFYLDMPLDDTLKQLGEGYKSQDYWKGVSSGITISGKIIDFAFLNNQTRFAA